ncbi:MAG: UDP-N-acetylmuramate--L-alanine ligase [Magnetococcales bacterium]|nr:UDP-N-acetylmuramate--L-alanine ligase [Magnetococcales bacterium]
MYKKIQKLHFVGIGGIGMSGIAEVLLNMGYLISGSDLGLNATIERLKVLGAEIHQGHDPERVEGVDAVVYSAAIARDNPEIQAARRLRIPVVPRAEMLAELMRLKYSIAIAGTHGKTTTTSIIATLLEQARMDPTVVNGGIVKALGSNARLGRGDFLVTEADESDGSFLKLSPTIAVITNIDPEHMEHYGNFAAVRRAFRGFAEKVPFYGAAVLCRDHPEVAALGRLLGDKRVITYGLQPGADYQAVDVRQDGLRVCFNVLHTDPGGEEIRDLGEVSITLPGHHNVANTLAAIAVARELEIAWEEIGTALSGFEGVQRRFDLLLDTRERVVIDDYAHHPTEIRATLAATRGGFGRERRLVAVFQPHRYSRVSDLLDDFCASFGEADLVLVDKIYPAGEQPTAELMGSRGQARLVEGIQEQSRTQAMALPNGPKWQQKLDALAEPGDVMAFLGAGDITHRARAFGAASKS